MFLAGVFQRITRNWNPQGLLDLLKREKHDMQAQFFIEKQEFLTKISTLEEEILMKKHVKKWEK